MANQFLTFSGKNAENLANALYANFCNTGFNALSKTDFYDFALHLLDHYSDEHFFTNNTNAQNALLLKITPAKVKTSKFNIHVKFTSGDEQKKALISLLTLTLQQVEKIPFFPDDIVKKGLSVLLNG
jgi:hypothetical protein